MPTTRRRAATVALLLAVALSGCAGLTGDGVDPDEYDADELQADALAATGDAERYGFAYEQRLRAGEDDLQLGVDASGVADEPAERTHVEFRTWIGSSDLGVDGEAYHDGETLHQRSEEEPWNSSAADAGYWAPTDLDVALLSGADVAVDGADTVDGREAVVLDVQPADEAAVARYGLDQALVDDLLEPGVEVESTTVRQYVAAEEPHRILRTEVEVTFVTDGTEVEGTFSTTYDYDGGGEVDVPDDLAA